MAASTAGVGIAARGRVRHLEGLISARPPRNTEKPANPKRGHPSFQKGPPAPERGQYRRRHQKEHIANREQIVYIACLEGNGREPAVDRQNRCRPAESWS